MDTKIRLHIANTFYMSSLNAYFKMMIALMKLKKMYCNTFD